MSQQLAQPVEPSRVRKLQIQQHTVHFRGPQPVRLAQRSRPHQIDWDRGVSQQLADQNGVTFVVLNQ
jgi:hypothetical protein